MVGRVGMCVCRTRRHNVGGAEGGVGGGGKGGYVCVYTSVGLRVYVCLLHVYAVICIQA